MANGLWISPAELGPEYATLAFATEACEAASFILWALSGRRYSGTFAITERYCVEERSLEERYFLSSDVVYPLPSHIFVLPYKNVESKTISPRGKPIRSITSIYNVRTGELIPSAEYNLWSHSMIKFVSGIPGDVDVSYTYGSLPPAAGKMAARQLAIQFALLWSGREEECGLPERVTSVTRQQVSWTILDNQDFIEELKTGVYAVDLFLKSVNPDKARTKSKVFSPDIPRGYRKTN